MNNYYYKVLIPLILFVSSCDKVADDDAISNYIYQATNNYLSIKNNNLKDKDYFIPSFLCRAWYGVPDGVGLISMMNINKDCSLIYYYDNNIPISGRFQNDTIMNDYGAKSIIMHCDYDKTSDCMYLVYKDIGYTTAHFMNDRQQDYIPVFKEENHTLDMELVSPPNTYWAKVNSKSELNKNLLINENGLFDESSNEHFRLNEDYQWFVNIFPTCDFKTDRNNLYLKTRSRCKVYKYHVDKTNNRLYLDDEEYELRKINK